MIAISLGYVPLTDAAPLLVARSLGLFEKHGLDISLHREVSWATIRDKLGHGALDGAHMLAPMALAATAGIDDTPKPTLAISALAENGSSFAFARALSQQMLNDVSGSPDPVSLGRALANLVRDRRKRGAAPVTLARVFPYSIHNYLLSYWLTASGIDPQGDVRLMVVPPNRMSEFFAAGRIDGCAVGAPWSDVADQAGLAQKLLRAADIWPSGPDKILGMSADRALELGDGVWRLQAALDEASDWCDDKAQRLSLLEILASEDALGLPAAVLEPALSDELKFRCKPRLAHGVWIAEQMARWGHLQSSSDIPDLAAQVYDHPFAEDQDGLNASIAPLFDQSPLQPK